MSFYKNIAADGFSVLMLDTSGNPVTTGTATAYVTIDDGTQTAISTAPTHKANGQWTFGLTASELNGNVIGVLVTLPGALSTGFMISTEVGTIDSGTAQSATSTTLRLRSAASFSSNSDPVGSVILIINATTGTGQSAIISGWDNTTKDATVDAWPTTPTGTIEYVVFASPKASSGLPVTANLSSSAVDAIWDEDIVAAHTTANTAGKKLADSGASPDLLVNTTIATLSSQTVFTLTAGSSDDDAYKDMAVVITDAATSVQKSVCRIESYVGSTKEITLKSAPAFTIATTDIIDVIANTSITETDIVTGGAINTTAGAVDNVTLTDTTTTNTDMRGTDNAALASVVTETRLSELDAATAGKMANQVDIIQTDTTTDIPATLIARTLAASEYFDPATDTVTLSAATHTGAVIPTVSTLTGHTPQTGDTFAQVGASGAGLTDLGGMSAAMKAEILAEVQKLLTTQMTESYAADGVAPTLTQALMLIQQALTEFEIIGATNTVKKLDGTTTAATLTLNDAASPTGVTRAT